MTARKLKQDKEKRCCDRCRQPAAVISECCFAFKHPFSYWKQRFETTGLRLTRRRQGKLGEEENFDWKHPPEFWLDLCDECFTTCSQPWDGFPMRFWEEVLGGPVFSQSAENPVPERTRKPAFRAKAGR